MVQDSEPDVLVNVLKHNRDQDLDFLINNPNYFVQRQILNARRPQDLDVFVHSKNSVIRKIIADYGEDKHFRYLSS